MSVQIELLGSSDLKALRLYSHSGLDTARACLRMYYLSHVKRWVPVGKALPLIFGSCWHNSMDVIWKNYKAEKPDFDRVVKEAYEAFLTTWQAMGMTHPDDMSPDDLEEYNPRIPQVALEMLYNYIDMRQYIFKDPSFKLLSIEDPFAIPLNPEDETLFYVGRLDKTIEYRKKVITIEHKTSTAYKKNGPFRQSYIDSFSMSDQVEGYLLKQKLEYGDRSGGVYVDAALVHKTIHDGFMFIPVDRQEQMLEAWLWTTSSLIDDIERNLRVVEERAKLDTPYLAAFPQNKKNCIQYEKPCPYFDICFGIANPAKIQGVPLGYKKSTFSIFDEIKLEKLGFKRDTTGEE